MIASISRHWKATIRSYTDEDDLVSTVTTFVRDVMQRELAGDLPRLDDSD